MTLLIVGYDFSFLMIFSVFTLTDASFREGEPEKGDEDEALRGIEAASLDKTYSVFKDTT